MKNIDFNSNDANNLKNIINSHKTRQNINSTPETEEEQVQQENNNPVQDKAVQAGSEAIKEVATEGIRAATGNVAPRKLVRKAVDSLWDKMGGDEAAEKIIEEGKKKVKQKIRQAILKALAPAVPYILTLFVIVIIVTMIMTEFYQIVDKVDKALVKLDGYEERFLNWSQGNGWKSEDEVFIKTLYKEYNHSKDYTMDGKGFNAALIASTIHYNYMTELDLYKEDDDSVDDNSLHTEKDTGKPDEESLFDDFMRAKDTKNFYKTANDKLGEIKFESLLSIGERKLLGHLVKPKLTWERYTLSESISVWNEFFKYIGHSISKKDYSAILLSWMISPQATIVEYLKSKIQTAEAYADQGYSGWVRYTTINAEYEIRELLGFFEDEAEYETLSEEDAHNTEEEISGSILEKIGGKIEEILSSISDSDFDEIFDPVSNKKGAIFPAPTLTLVYTEEVYQNYLKNVYIPLTYGVGEPLSYGENPVIDRKLDTIVDEIYNQADTFNYLFKVDEPESEDCHYEYSEYNDDGGEEYSSLTVNGIPLTNDVIDHLYIRLVSGDYSGTTLSMEDYIIGVSSKETPMSLITSLEAIKANMIAQQTYIFKPRASGYVALHQEEDGNYYISIEGTSNAQGYKHPTEREEELRSIYNELKYSFLYSSSTGDIYNIQYRTYYDPLEYDEKHKTNKYDYFHNKSCVPNYVGRCMGQYESDDDAKDGKSYSEILSKYYEDSGLINLGTGKKYRRSYKCYSKGLIDGGYKGGKIRVAPLDPFGVDKKYYLDMNPCQVWLGQCSWYVGGRAIEVLSTVQIDEELRQKAIQTIRSICPNGNGWYDAFSSSGIFGHSKDYHQVKDFSIASYRCVNNSKWQQYGHVVFIEKVEGNNVYVSQGWTTTSVQGAGGLNGFHFAYPDASSTKPYTIEEMSNLNPGNGHGNSATCDLEFVGYIYLLN